MLTREVIGDDEKFRLLRDEWQELLHDSGSDCVFLTWDWLYTWWQHLAEDRKLLIILIRRSGRLIGIAPLAIRPSRWKRLLPFRAIEFLGSGNVGSDYLDLILRQGFESEALGEIAAELERRRLMLQLSNVREGSSATGKLVDGLLLRGWKHAAVPVDKCPYIDLRDKDWDSYLASLGRSHRANVRRRLRNLNKRFRVSMNRVADAGECRIVLHTMIDHHLQRLSQRGGSDGFHTVELVRFHEIFTQLALQRGWLRLFELQLDGRPAASFYCMNYRDKYYYYQSGLNMDFGVYSAGLAGIAMLIEQAIAEGARELDFLHGEEGYKYLWANTSRAVLRFDLFLPYLSGRLYQQGMEMRGYLKRNLHFGQRSIPGPR